MADGLLSMANRISKTLHNGRGSNQSNYASGTSYGNLIPGTNIKNGKGLLNLAQKGRKGDTKIRKVEGRPSHVNSAEAMAIDSLGPAGEAWVKNVGSGTINPKTGLDEYFSLKGVANWWGGKNSWIKSTGLNTTWKPNEGKWGIFGQTYASRQRDKEAARAKVRKGKFEDWLSDYKDSNIAGLHTETGDDDQGMGEYSYGDINEFVKSGGFSPAGDWDEGLDKYVPTYDLRKQEELFAASERNKDKMDIQEKNIEAGTQSIADSSAGTQFGLLTQANIMEEKQDFVSAGDFASKFKMDQEMKQAEAQFGGKQREHDDLDLQREEEQANLAANVQDEQDKYNENFWDKMITWDTAINS